MMDYTGLDSDNTGEAGHLIHKFKYLYVLLVNFSLSVHFPISNIPTARTYPTYLFQLVP